MGSIAITKHTDQFMVRRPDQIEQPNREQFQRLALTSAGSYENAKETERDVLLLQMNTAGQSKNSALRKIYGPARTSGAEGQEALRRILQYPFPSMKTYYFILNNPSLLPGYKFQKKDAETGKIISGRNCVKILNTDTGKWAPSTSATQITIDPIPLSLTVQGI